MRMQASFAAQDLRAPAAHQHSVQFYRSDQGLIDELREFVVAAFEAGDPCLIVATEAHRNALLADLSSRRLDVARQIESGRLLCLDAAETLAAFSSFGFPDRSRFQEVIGGVITRLLAANEGKPSRVAVFGEMVALLWEQGKAEAALELEQLWNALLAVLPVSLRCAYPLAFFDRAAHSGMFREICSAHSHVIPEESYTSLTSETERRFAISLLQQKALALEAEIEQRKAAEQELRISQERLLLTQQAGRIGSWELDLESGTCILSDEAASMLGLMNGCGTSADLLGCMYYSGDRENFERCLKSAAGKNREFEAEFRLTKSGKVRWISARGKTFYNQGRPLLLGVLIDITAGKKAQYKRLSRKNPARLASGRRPHQVA